MSSGRDETISPVLLTEPRLLAFTSATDLHEGLLAVAKSLGLSASDPVLDLGCGTGAWLQALHRSGFRELWGIDLVAENFGGRAFAQFINADIENPDFVGQVGAGRFALVSAIEVIEHVASPGAMVEQMSRALRPGGYAIVSSPNIYSLRARIRFALEPAIPYFDRNKASQVHREHTHPIVLDAYRRNLFEPAGLSVERIWTHPAFDSQGTRWFARIIAAGFRMVLKDPLPGHILCLLLRKDR